MTRNTISRLLAAATATATAIAFFMPSSWAGPNFEPISLYARSQRSSTFDGCKDQFPDKIPIALNSVGPAWKPRGLCSDGFANLYSGRSKTPLVLVERLNRDLLLEAKGRRRTDDFYPDPRLPNSERSNLADFKNSGFDRGHMAAAGNAYSENAMAQSFALSNMVPQDRVNNQKVWNKVEQDTRKYVMRAAGDVFVFTGPLFDVGFSTMGHGNVYVPSRLFKLVYDQSSNRAWAFVLPNTADARLGRPISYPEFVRQTGWKLLNGLEVRP